MSKSNGSRAEPKVYFFGARNESLIKIGYTTGGLTKRRQDIENEHKLASAATGGGFLLLAALRACRADESALHRKFAHLNYLGEFFRADPELVDYIRWLRNQWFAVTAEDQDMPDPVSSERWFPGESRSTPCPQPTLYDGQEPWGFFRDPDMTGDDFYTCKEIIDAVRECLGAIDLDPASHPVANRLIQASLIYTNVDNGLELPWRGRVWLNPPFSQWGEWAAKVEREWKSGTVSEMCVLAATRTLTAQQFWPVIGSASAVCIFRGRKAFWGPKATPSPDDGHAVFYFGPSCSRFQAVFSPLGAVFARLNTPGANG